MLGSQKKQVDDIIEVQSKTSSWLEKGVVLYKNLSGNITMVVEIFLVAEERNTC